MMPNLLPLNRNRKPLNNTLWSIEKSGEFLKFSWFFLFGFVRYFGESVLFSADETQFGGDGKFAADEGCDSFGKTAAAGETAHTADIFEICFCQQFPHGWSGEKLQMCRVAGIENIFSAE